MSGPNLNNFGKVELDLEDAQRIFDIACAMDQACSGYMESGDVAAMRRLAEAIGADPAECTGSEFVAQYPHAYVSSRASLDQYRLRVFFTKETATFGTVTGTRPEADEEVLARIGVPEVCGAGYSRCGKPADDPIHEVKK